MDEADYSFTMRIDVKHTGVLLAASGAWPTRSCFAERFFQN